MPAIVYVAAGLLEDCADDFIARMDAGAGPGRIRLFTGPLINTAASLTTQVLLGTLICSDPCGSRVGGLVTFGAITQDSAADATGTAVMAQFEDSNGNVVLRTNVSSLSGDAAVRLNTVDIVAGGPIQAISVAVNFAGAGT